jgi:hypothetical protein
MDTGGHDLACRTAEYYPDDNEFHPELNSQ